MYADTICLNPVLQTINKHLKIDSTLCHLRTVRNAVSGCALLPFKPGTVFLTLSSKDDTDCFTDYCHYNGYMAEGSFYSQWLKLYPYDRTMSCTFLMI
jgi:hypothetical protein